MEAEGNGARAPEAMEAEGAGAGVGAKRGREEGGLGGARAGPAGGALEGPGGQGPVVGRLLQLGPSAPPAALSAAAEDLAAVEVRHWPAVPPDHPPPPPRARPSPSGRGTRGPRCPLA